MGASKLVKTSNRKMEISLPWIILESHYTSLKFATIVRSLLEGAVTQI